MLGCIQALWICNFNLLVESLGSHMRILTYLFRFNIFLNAEYLNKFFSESQPVEPVFEELIIILLLQFYEYQCDFIGPANCSCFCERDEKYLHILWERFFHTSEFCLVEKKCCSFGQGPLRFKASTGCLAILGCCSSPRHTL